MVSRAYLCPRGLGLTNICLSYLVVTGQKRGAGERFTVGSIAGRGGSGMDALQSLRGAGGGARWNAF